MPERNDKLLKEEVRGIFVLGVIGSLLALGRTLDVKVFLDVSLAELTNGLIVFWMGYVVLMAMGISDDVIRPSIVEFCAISAKLYFLAGIAILMTVPFLVGVYYFLRGFGVNVLFTVPIVIVIFFLFTLALRRKGFLFS